MRGMIQHWTRYLFPSRCLLCGDSGQSSEAGDLDLCPACQQDLPGLNSCCGTCARPLPHPVAVCGHCQTHRPDFDYMRCAFLYEPPVDWLIAQFKFNRRLSHGRLLSRLLRQTWPQDEMPDCIVPVPLHSARLRQRGFNQALELFRDLAKDRGIAMRRHLCLRSRSTASQSGLDGKARRKNVRGAFVVRGNCKGQHIVIVDDVVTTGSTISEMARVLKRAGAAKVGVWAVVRTPPSPWHVIIRAA